MLPFVESRLQWPNSAFTGSFTENPFWYQQFDLRQIRIPRGHQPIVDFDVADNFRFYVTTMKAMNCQDDIPSIPKRSLCAGVWLDFSARRYWKLSLSWTCWRTTETGTKFYPASWERYWTHCTGWTNVVGCSWQVWCCWKECIKMEFCSATNYQSYPSAQISVPWFVPLRLCSNSWQWHFCYYQHATQQYAGWTLDHDCNFPTWIVFYRLSWMQKVQFSQQPTLQSRWYQRPYSLTQVYAAFIQNMQLFLSSNSDKKKLQEFTMFMYFYS